MPTLSEAKGGISGGAATKSITNGIAAPPEIPPLRFAQGLDKLKK
jgi:hypothetical protein